MKINLQQLLPNKISDEAAFQLVMFIRNLAIALESNYFDNMLHHTSISEDNPFDSYDEDDHNNPF